MIGIAREHCFIALACQRSILARMAVLVMASTPNQAPVIQVLGGRQRTAVRLYALDLRLYMGGDQR